MFQRDEISLMVSGGWHEGMEKEGWREPSWGWEDPARWGGQNMMKDCDEEDRYNFDLTGGRRAWFPRVSHGWTAPQACLQRKRGTSPPPPHPLVCAFLSGLIWFPLLYLNFVNCPSKYKDIATKKMEVLTICTRSSGPVSLPSA